MTYPPAPRGDTVDDYFGRKVADPYPDSLAELGVAFDDSGWAATDVGADAGSLSVAQNMLELASGLNTIHKVVRHYYLLGKKTSSSMTLMQLQMSLPQIMEQAFAMSKAMDSVKTGMPIGDGVGPLVASKFLSEVPKQTVAKDTVVGMTAFEGRTLYVMKAEGPMG